MFNFFYLLQSIKYYFSRVLHTNVIKSGFIDSLKSMYITTYKSTERKILNTKVQFSLIISRYFHNRKTIT